MKLYMQAISFIVIAKPSNQIKANAISVTINTNVYNYECPNYIYALVVKDNLFDRFRILARAP